MTARKTRKEETIMKRRQTSFKESSILEALEKSFCQGGAIMKTVCMAFLCLFVVMFSGTVSANPGSPCASGKVYDCVGNCVDEYVAQSWIGDGYCDDGSYGMNLRCREFEYDQGDCKASPIARWNFEYDLTDDWGCHDGAGHNSPGYAHLGINDTTALRLTRGYNHYVTVSDAPDLRSNSFSITAWARVMGYQNKSRVLINKYNHNTSAGYIIYVRSNNKWAFKVGASNGGHLIEGPEGVKGQWVHLAATFEQTSTYSSSEVLGTMRFYINGRLYHYDTNVRYKPNSGSINLVIGSDWNSTSGYFNRWDGLIEDVRFYSNIVSTANVRDLYRSSDVTVEIMTYNICYGALYLLKVKDKVINYNKKCKATGCVCDVNVGDRMDEIIDLIKSYAPDILLIQEAVLWAQPSNGRLQAFADKLGMPYTLVSHQNGDWFKVAILSKFPTRREYLLPEGSDDFHRNIADTLVDVTSDRSIGVANVHFAWWGAKGWEQMTDDEKKQSYRDQKEYLMGSEWMGHYLANGYVVGGDWSQDANSRPVGDQANIHDAVRDFGFGLDKLRYYNGNAHGPDDTFYVSPTTDRLETLDCEEIDSREYSDHEPVLLRILVKD